MTDMFGAKPKEELITQLECLVTEVTCYTKPTAMTPDSEIRIGGHSPRYATGLMSETILSVYTDSPVRRITMPGIYPLENGDQIRAYILKGVLKEEQRSVPPRRETIPPSPVVPAPPRRLPQKHWIERDWHEDEKAVKIEKLRAEQVVATYVYKEK